MRFHPTRGGGSSINAPGGLSYTINTKAFLNYIQEQKLVQVFATGCSAETHYRNERLQNVNSLGEQSNGFVLKGKAEKHTFSKGLHIINGAFTNHMERRTLSRNLYCVVFEGFIFFGDVLRPNNKVGPMQVKIHRQKVIFLFYFIQVMNLY